MAKYVGRKKQTPQLTTLELTEGEVDFLLGVLSRIGGNVEKSPRKYAARIHSALEKAVNYTWMETDALRLTDGMIHCYRYDGNDS